MKIKYKKFLMNRIHQKVNLEALNNKGVINMMQLILVKKFPIKLKTMNMKKILKKKKTNNQMDIHN